MRTWMAAAGVAMGMVLGCVGPNGINANGNGGNGQGGAGTNTIGTDSGLPCAIADVLSAQCVSCHGSPPTGNAPMPLLSHADLTAQKNGKSYAQLSLERMQDTAAPMPPGGGATAADIQAFQDWINAGTPMGDCGGVDAGPPDPAFQGDPTCDGTVANHISEQAADGLPDSQLAAMNPGEACLACHKGEPPFNVAGTVFSTGKVLDLCLPPPTIDITQAKVVITDKNGVDHSLYVNKVGNFHSADFPAIAMPYTARVEYMGKTRAMSASQTDGDCNKCHTATGTQGAPGRIALPQ